MTMGNKLSLTERIILILVVAILAAGIYLFYTSVPRFEVYTEEDGLVEWLTVLGLLLGCGVSLGRFFRLLRRRSAWFLFVVLMLSVLLFAAAGEEISWGQRILGIKSSEYFVEHNAQGETNFHNLVVDGVKLNKLIFTFGLVGVMAVYLLIFPIIYNRSNKFRNWIDASGIMIPQFYQVLSIGLLFGLTEIMRHGKRAEILEAGIALLFFLIVLYPRNRKIYDPKIRNSSYIA